MELQRQSYAQVVRKDAPVWKAKIYIGMERYSEVLDLEDEAERKGCPIAPFLAISHARLGNVTRALGIAKEALRTNLEGAEMALGHVYFADQAYEQALRWYEKAARNRLQRETALRAAGNTLIALGDYREARVAYAQAIRLSRFVRPEDLLQLANCLFRTGQERAAAEMELLAHEKS